VSAEKETSGAVGVVPAAWPFMAGPGGCNPWFRDAAAFVALVQDHPSAWLEYSDAKYLNVRIDTRSGDFLVTGRDGCKIDMARLLEVWRTDRWRGAYRERARATAPHQEPSNPTASPGPSDAARLCAPPTPPTTTPTGE